MLEEGLQLPGLGEKGYSPSVPSNPASLVQVHGVKQLSGDEFPSSVLTQLWREGSAPVSLLNYSLLRGEGEPSGSGCCFLQLPKGDYSHPTTFTGSYTNMPQCKSTVTPIGRVEVEQRRERKGVHPSKTPTQEGKSSSRLPALIPTVKQALADTRYTAGRSYHHPQAQELLP